MDFEELIRFIFELVGTVAFAISGAMVAIKKKVDIFGVIVLSAMTALGGGIVRDILIGCLPPRMFSDYRYVLAAVVTAVIVFVVAFIFRESYRKSEKTVDEINNIFDARSRRFHRHGSKRRHRIGLHRKRHFGCLSRRCNGSRRRSYPRRDADGNSVRAQKKNICRCLYSRRNGISSDVYSCGKHSPGNRHFCSDSFRRQNPCHGVQA